jgi:hypothetical protein
MYMSWIMSRIGCWLMSLPYQIVAAYGWPGLAVAVCAVMLAFKMVKASTRKLRTAGICGVIALAALSFLPRHTVTAAPASAVAASVPAKAEEPKKEEMEKPDPEKDAEKDTKKPGGNAMAGALAAGATMGGTAMALKGSGSQPVAKVPQAKGKRGNKTPRDDKGVATGKRMRKRQKEMLAEAQRRRQKKSPQQPGKKYHPKANQQKPPDFNKSAWQDSTKAVREKAAANRAAKGLGPAPPVGSLGGGSIGGMWRPRVGPMGGHGGGNR